MRKVEITVDNEVCRDESNEETLVRNLYECISIFNNINKELKESGVVMSYKLCIDTEKDITISSTCSITICKAEKIINVNYVRK